MLFSACLQLEKSRLKQHGRVPLGILLVVFVLLLNFLAASPSLHERIHADAGQVGHQCAVMLFAHGQVDAAAVDISVSAPPILVESIPSVEFSVFSPAIGNLPAGRAPPVSSSNS
jgi:hypothetical protein